MTFSVSSQTWYISQTHFTLHTTFWMPHLHRQDRYCILYPLTCIISKSLTASYLKNDKATILCLLVCRQKRLVYSAYGCSLCSRIHVTKCVTSVWLCHLRKHNGPNNSRCTHSTSHTIFNDIFWKNRRMGGFCRRVLVVLSVYVSTGKRPSLNFTPKQNKCVD